MDKISKLSSRDLIIIITVMAAFYAQHLLSFRLAMNFEEARGANAYLLAMQGKLPYLDFEWVYGPLSFLIYPFIMRLFGVSLVVLRLSYIIFASFVIPLTYFLSRRIMPSIWAGIASFMAIVFFDVPSYAYNHIFAVLGGLGCLLMLCRFIETKKAFPSILWAGVFASITMLTKPFLPGASLFAAVTIFILFFHPGDIKDKVKNYSGFIIASAFFIFLYFIYFQHKSEGVLLTDAVFSDNSLLVIEQMPKVNLVKMLKVFLTKFSSIFPSAYLLPDFNLKKFLVLSSESFVFCLPIIATLAILALYIPFIFNRLNEKIKKGLISNKGILLLLCVFSFFICQESLMTSSKSGISFIIQAPFILMIYLLYLIWLSFRRKYIILIIIFVFISYLSFLHFIRYPITMFKKYDRPLRLNRAGGILVSHEQKELYESLSSYLSSNVRREGRIAVMGYYPHLAFLTEQKNIFEDDEYIFPKLNVALSSIYGEGFIEKEREKSLFTLLENQLLNKIKKEKPEVILFVKGASLYNFKEHNPRLMGYIEKEYLIDKVFGPADIYGLSEDGIAHWVEVYKLKAA